MAPSRKYSSRPGAGGVSSRVRVGRNVPSGRVWRERGRCVLGLEWLTTGGFIMKRLFFGILSACGGFVALLCGPCPALAQTAPPLGSVIRFSVLANSGVTGSTGTGTVVEGDVGSSPTPSISNFPPSSVTPPFSLHLANDAEVQQARTDAIAAYNFLAAQGPGTVLPAQLNGAVLTSGIYSFSGGAADLAAAERPGAALRRREHPLDLPAATDQWVHDFRPRRPGRPSLDRATPRPV